MWLHLWCWFLSFSVLVTFNNLWPHNIREFNLILDIDIRVIRCGNVNKRVEKSEMNQFKMEKKGRKSAKCPKFEAVI